MIIAVSDSRFAFASFQVQPALRTRRMSALDVDHPDEVEAFRALCEGFPPLHGGILRFPRHRGEPIRLRARKVMAQPRLRGAPVLSCERSRTKETDHPCLYECTYVRARARTAVSLSSLFASVFLRLLGGPRHVPLCHFEEAIPMKDRKRERERERKGRPKGQIGISGRV